MLTIYLQNVLELFTFACYNKEKTKKRKGDNNYDK
nr:MAG TPA: hypothetical protein [Caudoviricetes sp.]